MSQGVVPGALIFVALVHWLPAVGVLGADRPLLLYDVAADEPNLELLLRHRAVLFSLLGCLLFAGAFVRALQWPALLAGLGSVGSFLWLAAASEPVNAAVQRVVTADWAALATLLSPVAVKVWSDRQAVATDAPEWFSASVLSRRDAAPTSDFAANGYRRCGRVPWQLVGRLVAFDPAEAVRRRSRVLLQP
ncbi:MAG: hypothetical protein AAGH76_17750 [Pseudomonadota bacterium]